MKTDFSFVKVVQFLHSEAHVGTNVYVPEKEHMYVVVTGMWKVHPNKHKF